MGVVGHVTVYGEPLVRGRQAEQPAALGPHPHCAAAVFAYAVDAVAEEHGRRPQAAGGVEVARQPSVAAHYAHIAVFVGHPEAPLAVFHEAAHLFLRGVGGLAVAYGLANKRYAVEAQHGVHPYPPLPVFVENAHRNAGIARHGGHHALRGLVGHVAHVVSRARASVWRELARCAVEDEIVGAHSAQDVAVGELAYVVNPVCLEGAVVAGPRLVVAQPVAVVAVKAVPGGKPYYPGAVLYYAAHAALGKAIALVEGHYPHLVGSTEAHARKQGYEYESQQSSHSCLLMQCSCLQS